MRKTLLISLFITILYFILALQSISADFNLGLLEFIKPLLYFPMVIILGISMSGANIVLVGCVTFVILFLFVFTIVSSVRKLLKLY